MTKAATATAATATAPTATAPAPAPAAAPEVGAPVLDPISGLPCRDAATGRPYIVGPDGKPVLAPVVVPGPAERVKRLEDAVAALALFTVENQPVRFTRSLMACDAGAKVLEFVDAVTTEREVAQSRS
ncbi:MAG: hypothetical protein ACLQCU_00260 [Acidimicrobiales bacterium]